MAVVMDQALRTETDELSGTEPINFLLVQLAVELTVEVD